MSLIGEGSVPESLRGGNRKVPGHHLAHLNPEAELAHPHTAVGNEMERDRPAPTKGMGEARE